jgi:uracil phosphoribosyltransferase
VEGTSQPEPVYWPRGGGLGALRSGFRAYLSTMTTKPRGGLTVLDHPLIRHKMTLLRDVATSSRDFKQLVGEIAALMTYEVTRDLRTEAVEVVTPLETTTGERISGKIALVPILRAGLGMVEGIVQLIPNARVGHIGLYRDHATLQPVSYYFKVPTPTVDHRFFLLDPMLATGGSAAAAAAALKQAGARDISLICLVAAPEGVAAFVAAHADIPVYAAAYDRELNAMGYILPGLGDAGDRLFGTK